MCGHTIFARLCASLKGAFRDLCDRLRELFDFLCHNAKRSNLKRDRASGRLALGLRSQEYKAKGITYVLGRNDTFCALVK